MLSCTLSSNKPVNTWKNGIYDIHLVGLIAGIDKALARQKQHLNITWIVVLDLLYVRGKSIQVKDIAFGNIFGPYAPLSLIQRWISGSLWL